MQCNQKAAENNKKNKEEGDMPSTQINKKMDDDNITDEVFDDVEHKAFEELVKDWDFDFV